MVFDKNEEKKLFIVLCLIIHQQVRDILINSCCWELTEPLNYLMYQEPFPLDEVETNQFRVFENLRSQKNSTRTYSSFFLSFLKVTCALQPCRYHPVKGVDTRDLITIFRGVSSILCCQSFQAFPYLRCYALSHALKVMKAQFVPHEVGFQPMA